MRQHNCGTTEPPWGDDPMRRVWVVLFCLACSAQAEVSEQSCIRTFHNLLQPLRPTQIAAVKKRWLKKIQAVRAQIEWQRMRVYTPEDLEVLNEAMDVGLREGGTHTFALAHALFYVGGMELDATGKPAAVLLDAYRRAWRVLHHMVPHLEKQPEYFSMDAQTLRAAVQSESEATQHPHSTQFSVMTPLLQEAFDFLEREQVRTEMMFPHQIGQNSSLDPVLDHMLDMPRQVVATDLDTRAVLVWSALMGTPIPRDLSFGVPFYPLKISSPLEGTIVHETAHLKQYKRWSVKKVLSLIQRLSPRTSGDPSVSDTELQKVLAYFKDYFWRTQEVQSWKPADTQEVMIILRKTYFPHSEQWYALLEALAEVDAHRQEYRYVVSLKPHPHYALFQERLIFERQLANEEEFILNVLIYNYGYSFEYANELINRLNHVQAFDLALLEE